MLAYGLKKADDALASFIKALKTQGVYDSTLIIVTAKHGQSPINPVLTNKPGHFADLVAALPDAATDPGGIAIANANACSTGPCGFVQDDDVALICCRRRTRPLARARRFAATSTRMPGSSSSNR